MSTDEIYLRLFKAGARLIVVGGTLKYRGPKDAMTEALRKAISEHRAELLEELVWSDELPDRVFIPATVPNTFKDIRACIDSQRVRVSRKQVA